MGQWWQLCQQFCNNIHTKHPEDTNFLLCQLWFLHVLQHLSGFTLVLHYLVRYMACTNLPTTERSPGFHITTIVRWAGWHHGHGSCGARLRVTWRTEGNRNLRWYKNLICIYIAGWRAAARPLTAATMSYGRNLYLVQLWPAQSQVRSHPHEPRHSSLCGHTDKKRFIEISFLAPK